MLCEICSEREAELCITKIQGAKTIRVAVCRECLAKIKDGAVGASVRTNTDADNKRCRVCGTTWGRILADFTVGCPYCYTEFAKELKPVIDKVQKL